MQLYHMIGAQSNALSRTLLASACKLRWDMDLLPQIVTGQWGKPVFVSEDKHFNLSHSGNIVLCCLADSPVGVDIQCPRTSRSRFLDRVCTPTQRQWLSNQNDSPAAFALLWAVIESYYKYTGRGVPLPFQTLDFPVPEEIPQPEGWCYLYFEGLIFSLSQLDSAMISVCGTEKANTNSINLSQKNSTD